MTEAQKTSNGNGVARPVTAIREGQVDDGAAAGDTAVAGTQLEVTGSQSPSALTIGQSSTERSPKKRRKVNHGEVFSFFPLLFCACVP